MVLNNLEKSFFRSFGYILKKGGEGSGKKGHTTPKEKYAKFANHRVTVKTGPMGGYITLVSPEGKKEVPPEPYHVSYPGQTVHDAARELQAELDAHKIEKGGEGSGVRGHHTNKPYPGIEAHKMGDVQRPQPGLKTLQLHELPASHYTTPNLDKYRKLLHLLGEKANGNFTYDAKTDSIIALNEDAKAMVAQAVKEKQSKPDKPV